MNNSRKLKPYLIRRLVTLCKNIKNFLLYMKSSKYKFSIIATTICIISFFLGTSISIFYKSLDVNETLVHYINVGQGDAILIENNDFNILIDSGPNSSSKELISYLDSLNIKKLNYVIATHPHEDHIGNMDDILTHFTVKKFIAPKVTTLDTDFKNMCSSLEDKKLNISLIADNTTIKLSNNNSLTFLWTGAIDDNINNHSIVVKYNNKDISFIFTGDIENEVESKLISLSKSNPNSSLSSNVLKVSHHGSNTSSTMNFLSEVNPNLSIISCGMGNDYGHPHKNTLVNLNSINSHIYRTDLNGNIIVKTDGSSIWINTQYDN